VDDELADLIPLFLGEARERLSRLYELLPQVASHPPALLGARRELHTLEGSSRMLGFGSMANLCREGQTLLADERDLGVARVGELLVELGDLLATVAAECAPAAEPNE